MWNDARKEEKTYQIVRKMKDKKKFIVINKISFINKESLTLASYSNSWTIPTQNCSCPIFLLGIFQEFSSFFVVTLVSYKILTLLGLGSCVKESWNKISIWPKGMLDFWLNFHLSHSSLIGGLNDRLFSHLWLPMCVLNTHTTLIFYILIIVHALQEALIFFRCEIY